MDTTTESEQVRSQHEDGLRALENLRMRLLDLTARNRLINFRHTKTGSLRIIDEMPDQLVETLLTDMEMHFDSVPEPSLDELIEAGYIEIDEESGQEVRIKNDPTAEEWAKYLGMATAFEVPKPVIGEAADNHTDDAIQTLLFPYEMETRLKNLLQTSESAIQEMGANILYIAFGFLEWFDNSNDNSRVAPLFLVPVRLNKGRLNPKTKTYEYTLSYSGEDIIPNLSLREKLRADFAMALPDLDENTRPEAYFEEIQALMRDNQPHWRLRRYISLTLLNFSKLLMYLDLDPLRWPEGSSIVDHPVVTRFLSGYGTEKPKEESTVGDLGFGEEYLIDEIENIHSKYPLIDDADSSQHSALIDAVDGKNLVIEGPPGTGKSQTITNLIAAAMAQGKRVLFVAEKLAALEVVKRRLDAAGLGAFCMELHSHKSQKRKVLDEIGERINKHGNYRRPHEIGADIERYEELKTTLSEHVERINCSWKNTGLTLHEIFMAATRYREAIGINPELLHPHGYSGDSFDIVTQRRTNDQLEALRNIYQAVTAQLDDDSSLQQHPWYGVRNSELQIFDHERVSTALTEWQISLQTLSEQRKGIAGSINCELSDVADTLEGLNTLLKELDSIPELKGDEVLESLPLLRGEVLDKTYQYLKLFEHIQEKYTLLEKTIGADILQDLSAIDGFLTGSEQLRQLVGSNVELGKLSEAINRLTAIKDQLSELSTPLQEIQTAIGDAAAQHLIFNEKGINEFKIFVELVSSLQPSYWKLRDDIFDNDELDELLPELRSELEPLHALRTELQDTFKLDVLPSHSEIGQLIESLESGGLFRWFKGSWRTSRKCALSFATNNQIKLGTIQPLLSKYMDFALRYGELNDNNRYKQSLDVHFHGLDTNLNSLESLRDWYHSVRKQYGIGFGPKVALGSALLKLPTDIARGIRSLSERGLQQQIDDILDDLKSLKEVFEPVSELHENSVLIGEQGVIEKLLGSVDNAIQSCGPLAADNSISIHELANRIEELSFLRKSVIQWQDADYDNKLFKERLLLKTGLGVDNSSGLSALNNTLEIASCIDNKLTNTQLQQRIYSEPSSETFNSLSATADKLKISIDTQREKYEAFAKLVVLNPAQWESESGDLIDALITRNERSLNNTNLLQNWLDYVRVTEQVCAMGLHNLLEIIESGEIDITQAKDAHLAGVYDLLAREILREQPELGRFSGHSQNAIQDTFKKYDNRLKKLQCEQIAWQIDQVDVPRGNVGARVSDRSEFALLEHECGKKKRHIPIRQLLRRSTKALIALKPCFMMGPMSVAQYLAPGQIKFDLVVMDEASQIKPQDALGAIARGAQLVVVGDPKQLPPTSFFERIIEGDDEDPTALEESESILDATLPMFPARRLRWHYRSQHESLIAFSNQSFYESNLMIFPSPHKSSDSYGIQYSKIPRGCFVNRRNLEEARIISEAVREHFIHRPEETLGIVAMSADQRLQIERAIETLAKDDEAFQMRLDADSCRYEPLFIKNLENVQGDERDVIFISMTYGPQEPGGRVFQRFGPINSDVGWRRLNVLFTRSKKRMHIFSSMGSDDIVLSPTSKRGVKALRDFLSFCETGLLHETEVHAGKEPDSDFEVAVTNALKDKGFECVPQVGVAGFFIDIAVVDPGNPGRYLMGIECDGATYHSAKSARDRDRLRQTILERLGWEIRRIWSTDWFKNPHAELKPIIRELESLKTLGVEEYEQVVETELDEIEEIIEQVEQGEAVTEKYISQDIGLREKLIQFDQDVIRKALPKTLDKKRLLRPAMIEALLEYTPTSTWEFREYIPPYLRQATAVPEAQYLDQVLELINSSIEFDAENEDV